MGTPLTSEITKPDGRPYLSGTEREFDLMLAAFQQSENRRPIILAYTRKDEEGFRKQFEKAPDDQFRALIDQRDLAKSFVREHFRDADGRNIRAYHSYPEPTAFIQLLRTHLRNILNEIVRQEHLPKWDKPPFRSLDAFNVDHAQIFYGREEETYQVLQKLRAQEQAGNAFVVIIGASGSGKSSLAMAGVAASLQQNVFDEAVKEWRTANFVPSLHDGDFFRHLTRTIAGEFPELLSSPESLDDISSSLADDPQLTVKLAIGPAIVAASQKAGGAVKLLVVLDQLEELWTDRRITAEQRMKFFAAIEAMAKCGSISFVATLRSDFYAQAQLIPAFLRLKAEQGYLDLLPPDTAALQRLITGPARLAGLKFEREEGTHRKLDEIILQDAARDPAALPLLEYTLAELYERRDRKTNELKFSTYQKLGGIEGAIGSRASDRFQSVSEQARAALPEILPLLISVDIDGEQSAVRRRADLSELNSTAARRELVNALVQARFLTTDKQDGQSIASFSHEALLRRWDQVAAWIAENREHLRLRSRIEQNQQRWEESEKDQSLLLADGLPLEEGRQLLEADTQLLTPRAKSYIEESITYHAAKENKRRRRNNVVFALLSSLTLVAVITAAIAGVFYKIAKTNYSAAKTNEEKANGLTTEAQRLEREAKAETEKTEAALARSNYFLAEARWNENRVREANQFLELVPEKYRNFEWYLSRRQFLGSEVTCYGNTDGVTSVAFSPDGTRLASGNRDATIKLWDAETGTELKTLSGHTHWVTSVAFSPDGTNLASSSDDKIIKLWDVQTGHELKTLTGHTDSVTSVAFSPDGIRLASGSDDKTIKLWDVKTGSELKTLSGHAYEVKSVAFSPDGTHLASGSRGGTIKLWDAQTASGLKTFTGHADDITSVAFCTDGTRLASGSRDKTIKIWDAQTGNELKTLGGHTDSVRSVIFSPDGSCVASGSDDKKIKFWNAQTGSELKTFSGHASSVNSVAFSPDGSRLISGSADNTIKLWDAQTGSEPTTLSGHTDWVTSVAFSPDGNCLASGSGDSTIRLWDVHSGSKLKTLIGHTRWVNSVAFSPDGTHLASGSVDETIRLWDAHSGTELKTLSGHSGAIISVAFSPDGTRLASASGDKTIKLWDAHAGNELKTLSGHSDSAWTVAFSRDGTHVASGSWDNTIRIWDVQTGCELKTLRGHIGHVFSIAFSPDGTRLASGGYPWTGKLWDSHTGRELNTLSGHSGGVESVAFSSDGSRLASGSIDKTIKLWDVQTGRELKTLTGHTDSVASVAFSPDGIRLASGSYDKTIKLWDAPSDSELKTLSGHTEKVLNVAYSPDGNRLASGSLDHSIRLWDAQKGAELKTLIGHTAFVYSVAFSPASTRIASGSGDKTIRLWDAQSGRELKMLSGHTNEVVSVVFGPDGKLIYSQSNSGEKIVWNAESGEQLTNAEWKNIDTDQRLSPDKRWLVTSSVNDVLLVDREFKNTPREKAHREFKARIKPYWHVEQADAAEKNASSEESVGEFWLW